MFLLSGCSSIKKYEEIVEGVMEIRQSDSVTYQVRSWVPINVNDSVNLNDKENKASSKDKEACIDHYRGVKFKDEALSIVYFMQCMNKKGWRLHTEELIIISH